MRQGIVQVFRLTVQLTYLILLFSAFFITLKYFMMLVLVATIIGGAFYCGWLCPFGTMQEVAGNMARLAGLKRKRISKTTNKYSVILRYVFYTFSLLGLAAVFLIDARITFLDILYGDRLSILSYTLVILFIILSAFFDRLFCNYFCVQGAYYGLFSSLRLFRIRRNEKKCIRCGKCNTACPMNINVSDSSQVYSLQCINCFICISGCPVKDTLRYSLTNPPSVKKDLAGMRKDKKEARF